ncbi:unnamed protein product [Hymenolepis diminuta]|uniref:Uncharacterized protein n=1 Tax=Hymenolepis diminuta TaxID=6216 RepID=A0A564YB25_HYMDI|nr:unnamed protein product [Hymenolepis diminuta]
MVGEGVKMANPIHDSVVPDFDSLPTTLVHKISASLPQSAQFGAQPNLSVEQKPSSPCQRCQRFAFPSRMPILVISV